MSANVGYATLQIIPSARGFASALNGQTAAPMRSSGRQGGARFGEGMLAAAKGFAGPLAGVFAVSKGIDFFKDAIAGASDLNEAGTALAQVFGKSLSQVQAFAAGGASKLGMTTLAAENAAQTFGVYGKAAGLSSSANAKFSTSLVGLSTDLASFYNTSPDEAMQAIAAGLRGEAEPLRRYGVLLNAATLKQQALKMGLIKTTKDALSPQNQVLAAQAVIMQQTKVAQGDFQRTSGGLANQQRILSAQWENAKTQLGTALLPAVLAVVKGLNAGLAPAMAFVQRGLAALGPIIAQARTFLAGLNLSGGQAGAVMHALSLTFASLVTFIRGLLPVLQQVAQRIVGALLPGFRSVATTLSTTFLPAFRAILPVLQPIAAFILRVLGGAVVGVIHGAFNVINGVLKAISGLFQIFASLVRGDWQGLWNGVKTFVSGILQGLLGAFQIWWNGGILSIFKRGAEFLTVGIWKKLWSSLKGAAERGMAALKGFFLRGLSAITGAVRGAVSAYIGLWRNLFSALFGVVRNGWSVLRSAFGGALAAIRSVVAGAMGAVRSAFSSAFRAAASAVRSAMSSIGSALRGLPRTVMSAVSGAGSWLLSAGENVIRGFVSGIYRMAGSVTSAIRNAITDHLPGFVKKALGINSPSRLFMGFGENVSEGMAIGITRGAGKITRAAKVLAPQPGDLQGVGADGTTAARAGRQVVVNNYNPVAEPTSVTVSKALTRLALLEV